MAESTVRRHTRRRHTRAAPTKPEGKSSATTRRKTDETTQRRRRSQPSKTTLSHYCRKVRVQAAVQAHSTHQQRVDVRSTHRGRVERNHSAVRRQAKASSSSEGERQDHEVTTTNLQGVDRLTGQVYVKQPSCRYSRPASTALTRPAAGRASAKTTRSRRLSCKAMTG